MKFRCPTLGQLSFAVYAASMLVVIMHTPSDPIPPATLPTSTFETMPFFKTPVAIKAADPNDQLKTRRSRERRRWTLEPRAGLRRYKAAFADLDASFVIDGAGRVMAYDVGGTRRWEFRIDNPGGGGLKTFAAMIDHRLWVASERGRLYRFDASTGLDGSLKVGWRAQGPPHPADGAVEVSVVVGEGGLKRSSVIDPESLRVVALTPGGPPIEVSPPCPGPPKRFDDQVLGCDSTSTFTVDLRGRLTRWDFD